MCVVMFASLACVLLCSQVGLLISNMGYKQNSLRVDDLKGDKRVNCVFIISAVALLVHAIM